MVYRFDDRLALFWYVLLDIVNEMDDIHWIILWISVIRS